MWRDEKEMWERWSEVPECQSVKREWRRGRRLRRKTQVKNVTELCLTLLAYIYNNKYKPKAGFCKYAFVIKREIEEIPT